MPDFEDVIIIDSDSGNDNDIDELRQLAIVSMVKHEKKDLFVDNENTNKTCSNSFISKRKKRLKSTEITNKINPKKIKLEPNNESLSDETNSDNPSLNVCKIESILNFNKSDKARNLLKEEELKTKLLKVLSDKQRFNRSIAEQHQQQLLTNKICYYGPALSDNDSDNDFDIYTTPVLLPTVEITDPVVLACHNSISQLNTVIDELDKSIKQLSTSIQNNLLKSRKVSMQIENLKTQKVEFHKEIIVNRRKMLDLNKIKKQKAIELMRYERKKISLSLKRVSNTHNLDLFRSYSPSTSCDTINDSKPLNFGDIIDCNHVICSAWINNTCTNQFCSYQHPKIVSKSNKKPSTKTAKIKENDRVFLKESNPTGFFCKLSCDACRKATILISSLHLNDDRFCKTCCQKLISMRNPSEILNQLIVIWHHIYKRFIMSLGVPVENRDPTLLENLNKCSQAMKIKLLTSSSSDIQLELLDSVGCHVIVTLNQQSRIDDLLEFIKDLKYSPTLIRFACNLPCPIDKLHRLLIDSIGFYINIQSLNRHEEDFQSLIDQFLELARSHIGLPPMTIDLLCDWLGLCINRLEGNEEINGKISILSRTILEEIIGPHFLPKQLTLSVNDIGLGDKYWIDRKDDIFRLAKLYCQKHSLNPIDIPYLPWMDPIIHLLLIKFVILSHFFTGNEDVAMEICEQCTRCDYFFTVLLSRLSLIYNSPMISIDIQHQQHGGLIEHTYNKSDWLLNNRSIKSCLKLLESVPHLLYRSNRSSIYTVKHYQHFLGLGESLILEKQSIDYIPKLSANEMKSIRNNSSAIWMCYVSLLALTIDNPITEYCAVLKSDILMSMMPSNHLNRIVQFIAWQLGKRSDRYCYGYGADLRAVVLLVKDCMEFEHFIDLVHSINIDRMNIDCQLELWLFLIDFCTLKFSRSDFDRFLIVISWKLLDSCRINRNSYHSRVLHHIIMCCPVRRVDVWLNFIQLLLVTADTTPVYELIDVCKMALSRFTNCRLLWQHYYSCAERSGDPELPRKIKLNAAKFGFELR